MKRAIKPLDIHKIIMAKAKQNIKPKARYRVYKELIVSDSSGKISCNFKYYDSQEKKNLFDLYKTLPYRAESVEDSVTLQKFNNELEEERKRINSRNGLCKNDAEKDFLAFYRKIGAQKKSQVETYNCSLNKVIEFFGTDFLSFDELEEDELIDYAGFLEESLPNPNSGKLYLQNLKHVIKRGKNKGLIPQPIDLDEIKIKGIPPAQKWDFSAVELNILLATPCRIEIIRLAFLFMCFTGLRISDLLNLQWGWLLRNGIGQEGKTIISFNMQKTGSHLTNLVNNNLIELLGKPAKETDKVFAGLEGISKAMINIELKKWVKAAGINKNISAHCGRVTFASRLYEATKDIYRVMHAMGHKNTTVTLRYIRVPIVDAATLLPDFGVNFDLLKNNATTSEKNKTAPGGTIAVVQENNEVVENKPIIVSEAPVDPNKEILEAFRILSKYLTLNPSDLTKFMNPPSGTTNGHPNSPAAA